MCAQSEPLTADVDGGRVDGVGAEVVAARQRVFERVLELRVGQVGVSVEDDVVLCLDAPGPQVQRAKTQLSPWFLVQHLMSSVLATEL